jgi:hypothetical protein
MSFKSHKEVAQPTHSYKISIKSQNGNTVGFINLSKNFLRATTGSEKPSFDAVQAINNGKLLEYLSSQILTLEETEAITPVTDIKDF